PMDKYYWMKRAQAAEASERLSDEATVAARCRAGRSAARCAALAQAAEQLLAAIGERPEGDPLHPLIATLRNALDDRFTRSMYWAIEEGVSIYTATDTARKMLVKMKAR